MNVCSNATPLSFWRQMGGGRAYGNDDFDAPVYLNVELCELNRGVKTRNRRSDNGRVFKTIRYFIRGLTLSDVNCNENQTDCPVHDWRISVSHHRSEIVSPPSGHTMQ